MNTPPGWYGGRNFGQIKLKRSTGTLKVQANPAAPCITINGPELFKVLSNCVSTNLILPTDSYTIRAEYSHFSQVQNVTVDAGQLAPCVFSPQLGALHLTCNRDAATFHLESMTEPYSEDGSLPVTLVGLPVGEYKVTTIFHDQQFPKSLVVTAGKTNESFVKMLLGAARIETVPSWAEVRSADGNVLGQTPLDLPALPPQTTKFNLSLNGYDPVSLSLEIIADQTNSCRTNLVSTRYSTGMREARAGMASADYQGAVRAVGEALAVMPNDTEALALQKDATEHLNIEQQKQNAEIERQARLKRPREVFDYVCAKNPAASLFAEHEMTTRKPAKAIAAAILKSFQDRPYKFETFDDGSPQPDIYVMRADYSLSLGILGGWDRLCLVVVGQTKDNETQVLYKVLEFQMRDVGGKSQMVPLHASQMQMTDMIQYQVDDGLKMVTKKIYAGLDQ